MPPLQAGFHFRARKHVSWRRDFDEREKEEKERVKIRSKKTERKKRIRESPNPREQDFTLYDSIIQRMI